MSRPSRAEILGFIASSEPLEKTLERFPGVTRVQLRSLLREAAVLMRAEELGVELLEATPGLPASVPAAGFAPATDAAAAPSRRLILFSDGAARGNPGPAGAGAVLTKVDGSLVARLGKFLGSQTNNHAEYMGLLIGLEEALRLGANEIEVVADSELMVRQLNGVYKVKNAGLKLLFERAQRLLQQFVGYTVRHVPRAQNKLADEMSNRAIDERL